MVSPEKILTAVRSNWLLNAAGLLLSFCATVVLVRTMTPELYAQYAAVLAIIWLATLVFEAGANSGLTRYLAEASRLGARGTFYRAMQRRRWAAAGLMAVVVIALGPLYASSTGFAGLAREPGIFIPVALIVAGSMTRALAHYGLVALFETKKALVWEQTFLVSRSLLLAAIAVLGGSLWHLVAGFLFVIAIEAVSADLRLWRLIRHERDALPGGFLNRAQSFGLMTIFDKLCAALGSGGTLLLALAPFHSAGELALLALATDLCGKILSITVMPMGNLVGPYLSQVGDDSAAQGRAAARVVKLSLLPYCITVGGAVLVLPAFIPLVYGSPYAGAIACAVFLLVPAAFENWVRGCCSPALLRIGRYRTLALLNILQAAATITAIALVHREALPTAVLIIGLTRAVVSSLSLLAVRGFTENGFLRVAARALLFAALAGAVAVAAGRWLPLAPVANALVQAALYTILALAGLAVVIRRDEDTSAVVSRLLGSRLGALLAWGFVGRRPLSNG